MNRKFTRTAVTVISAVGLAVLLWGISTSIRAKGTGFKDKALYDWLDLLIVPAVLSIGAWLLQKADREAQDRISEQKDRAARKVAEGRAQLDREIAAIRYREDRLQAYMGQMTELLLEKGLRTSGPDSEVRVVARARTLTTLEGLDGERKGIVLAFLQEANLITQGLTFAETTSVISLEGANFSGTVLWNRDLGGVDLRGANLRNADLRYCRFRGANLERADFQTAQLHRISLFRTRLKAADFSGADLSNSSLSMIDLPRADLPSGDLTKPGPRLDPSGVLLNPVQFVGANLSGATIKEIYLFDAKFNKANLSESYFEQAYLWRADFREAKLRGARLLGSYLARADLSGADLIDADLSGAYLGAANLADTDMRRANLSRANLHPSRADAERDLKFDRRYHFGGSHTATEVADQFHDELDDLTELMDINASQRDAAVRGSNLSEANLTEAKITSAQLEEAKSLKGTTMPDGTKHE